MVKQLVELNKGDVIRYPDGEIRYVVSDVRIDSLGQANFYVKVALDSTLSYSVSYKGDYELDCLS